MALRDVRTMLLDPLGTRTLRDPLFRSLRSVRRCRPRVLADGMQPLPPFTNEMLARQLDTFDLIGHQLELIESRIEQVIQPTDRQRLQTTPGVGKILGPVIASKPRRAPLRFRRTVGQLAGFLMSSWPGSAGLMSVITQAR